MSQLRSSAGGSSQLPYIKRPEQGSIQKLIPWAIEISTKLAVQRQILEGHLEKLDAIDKLLRAATLEIANNLTVPGNLAVTGTSALTGKVTASGAMDVAGLLATAAAVTVGTTLVVSGASTVEDIEINAAFNHDGSTVGFYGVTPVTRPSAYTVTNHTADRVFDADTVAVEELADIVGSMLIDLNSQGLLNAGVT